MSLSKAIEDAGFVHDGHFKLRSGKHSNKYIDKDLILTNPSLFGSVTEEFKCKVILKKEASFTNKQNNNLVIAGPAIAGAIFSSALAYSMHLPLVYPEKIQISEDKWEMQFRSGFRAFLKGKFVVLIEDVVTTGDSILKTVDAVNNCGGVVIYTLSLWDRGSSLTQVLNYRSLIYQTVPAWEPDECPLCINNIKMTPTSKGDR